MNYVLVEMPDLKLEVLDLCSCVKQSTCTVPCMVYKPLLSAQAWITQFTLQGTPCLPLPCKRSPDGAFTD